MAPQSGTPAQEAHVIICAAKPAVRALQRAELTAAGLSGILRGDGVTSISTPGK